MRVLFAIHGSESSNAALTMLEGLGDRDAIDLTVMSISPEGSDLGVLGAGISPVGAAVLGSTGDVVARNAGAAVVGRSSQAPEGQGGAPEGSQS